VSRCRTLDACFVAKKHKRNQLMHHCGEIWKSVYFIKKGVIRLFYVTEDGREFNKGFFFENQFLWPMVPLAQNNPSLFAISAIPETHLLEADLHAFRRILKEKNLWDRFALIHTTWLAEEKVQRESNFLLNNAEKRYDMFISKYGSLQNQIPDFHIASYLGITNVSLSRIKKKKLKRDK